MGLHNLLPIATLVFRIFFAHILVEKAEVYGVFFCLTDKRRPPTLDVACQTRLIADDGGYTND